MERDIKEQKEILKWILSGVKRARRHKEELTERLNRIRATMTAPKSPRYSPLPRSQGSSEDTAKILEKLAEIELRISNQRQEMIRAYNQAMDIIDLIPVQEPARRIFELRYLDGLNMHRTALQIPMSPQNAYIHYNKALNRLLGQKTVIEMVDRERDAYKKWING